MISKKNLLELDPRRKIYDYIFKNPGLHFREIQRKMNIPYGTLNYHIKYLVKQDLVSSKFENGYRRYFISEKLGRKEEEVLNLLRQEVPRYILLYIMFHKVCSQVELSKALEKKPSTIDFHLNKLRKLGFIERLPKKPKFEYWGVNIKRIRISNEILYSISNYDVFSTVYNMLIVYKSGLPDENIIDDVFYTFMESIDRSKKSSLKGGLPSLIYKKPNTPDVAIDMILELVYEIFPHPYYA